MSLFNFFRNTLHEVTIVKNGNWPKSYSNGNTVCNSYSIEKNCPFSTSEVIIGSNVCRRYCKHCLGCTTRYTAASYKGYYKEIQYFVKCKCGHNNIFNIWRRIKYVLSGKRTITKIITNDGIKQIN